MIKSMPITDSTVGVQISVLQDASSMIWMAAPWRWSVGNFAPANLTQSTSNVNLTAVSDFLKIEKIQLADTVTSRSVQPVSSLPSAGELVQFPNTAMYVAGSPPSLLFDTILPTFTTAWQAYVWYKRQAPVITTSNYQNAGVLVQDDEWYWVYNECVLYYAYKFADDQRAGGATIESTGSNMKMSFTGQRAVAEAAIQLMREREQMLYAFPVPDAGPIVG